MRLTIAAALIFSLGGTAGALERLTFAPASPMTLIHPIAAKGTCGAMCEDATKGNFKCEKGERPQWDDAQNCRCVADKECTS